MKQVFVIGGAAIDISGMPERVCRLHDSNIGTVRISVGGVGRNLAKRLAAYEDTHVELVTALGDDGNSSRIEQDCARSRIGMRHVLRARGACPTYLCIHDSGGDLLCAISDMEILSKLAPDFLAEILRDLNRSDMCVLDANLPVESLAYLTENLTAPIFFDPVSCIKAARIGDHLGKCFAVKPNRMEATELSGCDCDLDVGLYHAADKFLGMGVRRVFISLDRGGIFHADKDRAGIIPAELADVLDTTGAGDAMGAAIVHGCMRGLSTEECARKGNHASALVCARLNA